MKNYSAPSRFIFSVGLLILLVSPAALAKKVLDKTIVVVNNEIILDSDIRDFQRKLKSKSFQELFGGMDPATLKDRKSIIQLLVEEKLINQNVKKLDLSATDEEIDGQIRAIMKRNGITRGQLNERLVQLGSNLGEYRDGIKRQIERKNLVDREIRADLKISDEHLRHYFQRTNTAPGRNQEYHLAQILISNGENAKARADNIYKEISSGNTTFENAVKEYSDDSSRETGGDLGFLSTSSLSKEFLAVVPKMNMGEVTRPIKTSSGYHILKVIESRKEGFDSLSPEQKESLRNAMYSEELEKRMLLWLERKKKDAYIHLVDVN